jgi:hypothetical protein
MQQEDSKMPSEIDGLRVPAFAVALAATAVLSCGAAWADGKHRYNGPNPAVVHRSITKGESVSLSYVDSMTAQFLNAVRSDVAGYGAADTAFMSFQATTYDPTSRVCTTDPVLGQVCSYTRTYYDLGNGDIPINDLTVNTNGAHLHTDITSSATLYFIRCTVDDVAMTTDCINVPPSGIIDLTWVKTSEYYFKSVGYTEQKVGPELTKINASQQQYSSRPTGSMIGWTIGPAASGVYGTSNNMTIDIVHAP